MNLLQRYRNELVKEREGKSKAFAKLLQIGNNIFYIFVGLSISAIILGFWESDKVPINSIDAAQQKAFGIFFGFIASAVLVSVGIFFKGLIYLIFTDRR